MVALVLRRLEGLRGVSPELVVFKSTSVPGLEGEKVLEISEEAWPDIVTHLRTFEVNTAVCTHHEVAASESRSSKLLDGTAYMVGRGKQRDQSAASPLLTGYPPSP